MNEQLIFDPSTAKDIENVVARIKTLTHKKAEPVVVALDGRSGTGKSTIAEVIASRLGGVYIKTDDFWAGGANELWDARSIVKKVELAIDWQRLRKEVVEPLLYGKQAQYHPYDFINDTGLSKDLIIKEPSDVIVLDGAYSSRPELEDIIDLKILVEVPNDNHRRTRLVNREGDAYMTDWHKRWDPAEDYYFSQLRKRDSFDMIIVNH